MFSEETQPASNDHVAPASTPESAPASTPESAPASVPESPKEVKTPEVKPFKTTFSGSLGTLVLIATIISLLGTGVLFLYKSARDSRLTSEKNKFNGLNTQLTTGSLAKLSSDLQEIADGQTALTSALKNRVQWSNFWDKLSKATPKSVYYTSFSLDSSNGVSISGAASDLTSVAKLMVSLQQSPLFSGVTLGNTSVKDLNGKFVTAFSVAMKVNPSELLNSK